MPFPPDARKKSKSWKAKFIDGSGKVVRSLDISIVFEMLYTEMLIHIEDVPGVFEKAVEGIVFRWKGKTRKLTGLFTPINKLRGFFAYGKTPAKISTESRKRYLPFGRIG